MRSRFLLLLITAAMLAAPASASASFGHVIAQGESLSSVAAADGLSLSQLAAANGLDAGAQLTAGATLQIPPQTGAPGQGPNSLAGGDASAAAPASGATAPAQTASAGSYVVQPGDTLSAIAVRQGVSVDALAAANGLDPGGLLPAGALISVTGGGQASSSGTAAASSPTTSSAPSASASTGGGAQPTAETVSPSEVGSIAAASGVSPSLAQAIGDQESGFNNAMVSSTGATGVMQIEPGTWNYIGQNLGSGPPPLSPASARDNVRAGVLLLRSLLDRTGGDPALAAAGYYQGLGSVQQHGMYSDTQQYVNDVMALRQRFGGP